GLLRPRSAGNRLAVAGGPRTKKTSGKCCWTSTWNTGAWEERISHDDNTFSYAGESGRSRPAPARHHPSRKTRCLPDHRDRRGSHRASGGDPTGRHGSPVDPDL